MPRNRKDRAYEPYGVWTTNDYDWKNVPVEGFDSAGPEDLVKELDFRHRPGAKPRR